MRLTEHRFLGKSSKKAVFKRLYLVGRARFELATNGLRVHCSTS
jgi:hypothetical protein